MSGQAEVVIAGTKPFALALFAPVTERAGSRPRIAPEPAAALTLCAQSTDLLVVEYEPRWLPALTKLRLERPALRVVAALPRGQEGAALALGPLSIDAVPWDGQAISVMPAIGRALDGARSAPATAPVGAAAPRANDRHAPVPTAAVAVATRPPAAPSTLAVPPQAAAPAAPATTLDLFRDLGATVATPYPASLAAITPPPPPSRTEAAWPAAGPSAAEAELAVRVLLAGRPDTSPLRAVTEQTVAGLSGLERDAFSGAVPVDAELIRHAAVLRLRAAAALVTRPAPGTPIDSAAIAELLSEIDGVLHQVKALLDGATPEVKVQLEAIRNALVKEAVDFSEACHEIGTAELPLVKAPEKPTGQAPARAVSGARILTVKSGEDDQEVGERKRSRVIWSLFALALIAAGAIHGYRWWKTDQVVAQMKTLPGQPERMMLLPAPPGTTTRELVPMGGVPDRAEVERFKAQQRLLGNTVTETSLGGLVIKPEAAPPAGEKGSKP